jgi:uncharacterized low-complexity protein
MSEKSFKKPLAIAMGATFAAALSASPVVANADTNPFGMQNLSNGYMQLAEGKCGEGKCGGMKDKEKEGKCGGKSEKEGKCGEGKCGGMKEKEKEKEGKCGGKSE